MSGRLAVITGASSGIGAATARALAGEGFDLLLGARRLERLREVAAPLGAEVRALDVADPESVDAFCSGIDEVDVLVNNAGAALGLDRIGEAVDERWESMFQINVLGVVRMCRALLPGLEATSGHVVVMGSTSGFETYPGGAGYTASKHALRAVTRTLRQELLGRPIRITEISPGLVETEFSLVRFEGDRERAAGVRRDGPPDRGGRRGVRPLGGEPPASGERRRDRGPPARPGLVPRGPPAERPEPGRIAVNPPRSHRLALLTLGLCGVLHLGCQELLPQRSEGEKLYRRLCADCHGIDASGNTPRFMGNPEADLLDDAWYEVSGDDGAIASLIRTGIPGRPHPEKPDLTPEQAQAIVEHIRHLRVEAGAGN